MSRSAELENEMRDLKIARSEMQESFSRIKDERDALLLYVAKLESQIEVLEKKVSRLEKSHATKT